jgi:hypothetical protein
VSLYTAVIPAFSEPILGLLTIKTESFPTSEYFDFPCPNITFQAGFIDAMFSASATAFCIGIRTFASRDWLSHELRAKNARVMNATPGVLAGDTLKVILLPQYYVREIFSMEYILYFVT